MSDTAKNCYTAQMPQKGLQNTRSFGPESPDSVVGKTTLIITCFMLDIEIALIGAFHDPRNASVTSLYVNKHDDVIDLFK